MRKISFQKLTLQTLRNPDAANKPKKRETRIYKKDSNINFFLQIMSYLENI